MQRTVMELDLLLRHAVDYGATDIHLKVGKPPMVRCDGEIGELPQWPPLSDALLEHALQTVGASAPARLAAFADSGDLDIAYQSGDLPRFRVNAFRQRGSISLAFRVIPRTVPTFEQLNLPAGVKR